MSIRTRAIVLLIFASSAYQMAPLRSQNVQRCTLEGVVRLPNGQAMPGMAVLVLPASNSASPKSRTRTDDAGKYTIEGLTPGEYAIFPFNETTQYPLRANMFLSKSPDRITVKNSQTTVHKDLVLPSEAATVHGNVL